MQEEVNEKTISLCIKGGKITAQILKAALIKLLAEMDKKKKQQQKGKGQCKRTGKQSLKSLQKSGAQITNIVVTDNNIKSFDRVARKYGIDYSLKKVEQDGKTEYMVFFKAKDVDVMTAAFKEYTSETLKKQKRESVRQKLEKVKLVKLILTLLTLPLLVVVWLLKWFVTFLHCCSAWIFYLLGSVLLATAVLSFLMKQSQGIEALQMLIGGFVIFMIPQVVGSVVVFLELAAAIIRQVWYI